MSIVLRILQRVCLVLVALSVLAGRPALADSVNATKISLPKGPGSVEGLASADFAPSLASGTASYSVPIAVPPGAAGFGPSLSLSYDSGGGITEVGIGWRVAGAAKIRRRTEEGLPTFGDGDAFEIVGLGIPCDLLEITPGMFRPRYEDGSFVRVERASDGSRWEARTKGGVTLRFGGDGFTESEAAHTSAYLLREQVDRHGHRVAYEWDTTEGHALLTRVVWNDFDDASRNEVSFQYEDRPDTHRRFSAGILETITRRLKTVQVRHGGALVRRLDLAYGSGIHPALASVTLVGRDGTTALPAARFEYTEAKLASTANDVVTMTNAPGRSPSSTDTALADVDGDGLPDFLVGKAGQYRSYRNHDGKRWLPPDDWAPADSPSVSLGATGVQLADLDADGAPDLVVKSGTDAFRYFPHPTGVRFDEPVALATVPSFTFEDPDVRLGDFDGDRRTDVIVTTPSGIAIGYNQSGRDWTEPSVIGPVDTSQELRFSDGHTELCDVNGDRVLDFCYLRSGGLTYWLGRGRGKFERGAQATGVPTFDVSAPFRQDDLNGDGWLDLVLVDVDRVSFALATGEGAFGPVQTIEGTPTKGPATSVQFADMNGSGTVDIVWVDVTGTDAASWKYLELFPDGRAGLLRRIDNGLGKVQTIDYEPAALGAARARDARKPWATRMNVAVPIVRRVTVDSSLGDPKRVVEFAYRDGTYDPRERTFAAFGGGTQRDLGDDATPTLVTESTFDTGLTARVLRGATRRREVRTESGAVFTRTTTEYTPKTLATTSDGRAVEYAFRSSEIVEHVEGAASAARQTLTEFVEDDYGNLVEERRWGEIRGADYLVGNDEALVTRTYANDPGEWLLGYLATEELDDATGARVALTRKYYDGDPFQGLPLGRVARGDVTREEAWAGPADDTFELVLGTKYNADGQPVETKDARGGGHIFDWAPDHTSIRAEHVLLEHGRELVETAEVDGAFGSLLSVHEYNGQETRYAYDPFGRLEKVIRPGDTADAPTSTYSYTVGAPLSRVITEARVEAGKSTVEHSETLYDGLGRSRGTLTRDGDRWVLAGVSLLDARGNARRSLLPRWVDGAAQDAPPLLDDSPQGTDTWRDATGREIRSRSPSRIETRTAFLPFETRHWDGGQNDAASSYEHTPAVRRVDGLGRTIAHVQTLAGTELSATYTYDAAGSLLTRTDPENAVARYRYDGRGRRVTVTDPDLGEHHFAFDETSNLIGHTYPDGKTARFAFDLAGRSLGEDHDGDGTPEVTRTWDTDPDAPKNALALGKLVRITGPSGETRHDYDERGRATKTTLVIDGATYAVGSHFDDQDRESLHVYPDGSSIEIHRNPRGQISGYGKVLTIDYGGDGLETERRFNTGVKVTSDYDSDRRRSDLQMLAADGTSIERLHWTYDSAGNLLRVDDRRAAVAPKDDRSETYVHDNLYRLVGVTGKWGTDSWSYSPSGSLLSRTSSVKGQTIATVSYDARPHAPSAFDDRKIVYDDRARMTSDGSRTYTWNDSDELVAVANDQGSAESTYDGDGTRRIRVEHGPAGKESTTHFIDVWSEVKDGQLVRYIVHGGQRVVKLAKDNGASASATVGSPAPGGSASGRWRGSETRPPACGALPGEFVALLLAPLMAAATFVRARRRSRRERAFAANSLGYDRDSAGEIVGSRSAERRFSSHEQPAAAALIAACAAVSVASVNPVGTALALTLVAALASMVARRARGFVAARPALAALARARSTVWALGACIVVAVGVSACGGGTPAPASSAAAPHGSVQELTDADTLLATDLLGSLLGEASGSGKSTGHFTAYPFGATRFDTSEETRKYAGAPRDGAVGLDAMGARFFASDLGVWTSGDPLAVSAPEQLVTEDFAAANPYAYAKDSPLLAADRDGHFWHIAIGAAVGALMGGAIEAGRQYLSTGKVEDWGRVGAAAAGGAVSGAILAANPVAAVGSVMAMGAASGAAAGVTERLVASGGQSAGTLKEAVTDGLVGAGTAGMLKGGGALLNAAVKRAPTAARALAGRVTGAAEGAMCPCFAADTTVATPEGPRPIASLRVGDSVVTRDELTGETTIRPVTRVFITPDKEVLDLSFHGADGTVETITATPGHPFWVEGSGWVEARDLALGATVQTAESGLATLSAALSRDGRTTVYNLEVEGTHTYFVGKTGAWVHNACGCGGAPRGTPRGPGPTIDPTTAEEVGRFIVDPKGNAMIEPVGGSTVPAGRGGVDTHTTYPNGSNYQRLNPQGHTGNPTPHGHGHAPGTGPGMRGQGPSLAPDGTQVPFTSPEAHWPIKE